MGVDGGRMTSAVEDRRGLHRALVPLLRTSVLAVGLVLALVPPAIASGSGAGGGVVPSAVSVGGLALVAPRYEGSKEYRVIGIPIAFPSGSGLGGSGLVQFRGPEDLRLRLVDVGSLEAGPLAGWRFGRDEEDARRLRGLGDVDGGLVAGAYAALRLGALSPFVSYHRQLTGDETGALVRFGIESRIPLTTRASLLVSAGATYADKDYMASYFSVTGAQSVASLSRLPAFDTGAGIKDVHVGASGDLPLGADWTLRLTGRYSRLVGDAADSPVVESRDQLFGGLGLTYRFDLPR